MSTINYMNYKTIGELVKKLGVSKQAIYKAIHQGKIKTKTIFDRIVITNSEFDKIGFDQKNLVRWIVKK